jgi:hypothetical protein
MANDTIDTVETQPGVIPCAGSGLIAAIQTALPNVSNNANRYSIYIAMQNYAIEMRRVLYNADPQMDSAVLTAVTATLATL